MCTMIYKGYYAKIEYSDEDGCFIGHIADIQDVIGFHADSVEELRETFFKAVDDYLATCEKSGKIPQKPYSGHKTTSNPITKSLRGLLRKSKLGENDYKKSLEEKHL